MFQDNNNENEQIKKKSGKAVAVTVIILLILALAGCGIFYALKYYSPEAKTGRLIAQGNEFISEKEYDMAVDTFRASLELTPDSVEAYKGLVKVYEKTDDVDALMDVLEEAYKATKDKWFSKKLKSIEDELSSQEDTSDLPSETSPDDDGENSVSDRPGTPTLTMWCPVTEKDPQHQAFEEAIADMAETYPSLLLEWEAYDREAYKTRIKAAVAADELPDIFVTWSGAFLQDFVDAGKVYCLDDYYPDYCSELPEGMLSTSTFNGKHYGVPMYYNVVMLYANMDVLAKVGYDEIPSTYNDLIECCEALRAKGIYAFSCAGGENWCVSEYLETIFLKTIGADALNDIFLGRATWDNAGIAGSVDMLQDMISHYFDPDGAGMSNVEIKEGFLKGDFACYINGTWNCAEFSFSDNIEIGELPVIDSRYAGNGSFIGGPTEVLAVAQSSARRELAAQYCFELAKRISYYDHLTGVGLPSWRIDEDDASSFRLVNDAIDMCTDAKSFVIYGDTAMSFEDAGIYSSYLSLVYDSSIDGQGFAEGLSNDIR